MVPVFDLLPEFAELARAARTQDDFAARFRAWLEDQASGPLGPFLEDAKERWGARWRALPLEGARALAERLGGQRHADRARLVLERYAEVVGRRPACDVVLFAGLGRPEGYSRFDRGRNTVFIAIDNPANMAEPDQFEIILAHELLHAVRDPCPAVQADYGGWADMTHDDFVEHYPFREHLVSESLATSLSWLAYPGRPDRRYATLDEQDYAWCEAHRLPIARRIQTALDQDEDYGTFYSPGVVTPDAPAWCDYYLGLHLGRFALEREPARELVHSPARDVLARHLEPFLERFAAPRRAAAPPDERAMAPSVRALHRELVGWMRDDPRRAERVQVELERGIAVDGIEYADEPYPVQAFPFAIAAADFSTLRRVTDGLLAATERAIDLYREDPLVRAFFALPPHLEALVLATPTRGPHIPIARFDSYWENGSVRFLEVNTNGTAGIVLADRLAERFAAMPGVASILDAHGAARIPLGSRLVEAIRETWRASAADRRLPESPGLVAILDWPGLATRTELSVLARDFRAAGLDAEVISPGALTYDGRTLSTKGRPIDLVYRRLTTSDVIDQPDRLAPFLAACRDDRVVVVGSFPADVAHSKRLFAFLTAERWRNRFDPALRAIVDAHVPWTRILAEGPTTFEGRREDLPRLVIERRERLVIKPATRQEGAGVLLGLETSPEEWAAEVERRLGGDHVVQEYLEAPVRTIPRSGGDAIEAERRNLHLGEFMIGGRFAGLLARASTERVLSVASNERAMPCYVLEERYQPIGRPRRAVPARLPDPDS